jgi:hypothetical protein
MRPELRPTRPPSLKVFKSVRDSLSATAPTWAFRVGAFYVIQDHPAYIPRGQRWPLRPEVAAPLGVRPSSQLAQCATGRGRWKLEGEVAVLSRRKVCRISSSGHSYPDRFKLDQRRWPVLPGRCCTVVNCNRSLSAMPHITAWHLGVMIVRSSPCLSRHASRTFLALSTIRVDSPIPPLNPTAAKIRDGRVLSRPSSRVHEPGTLYRGGCPAVTDGLDRFRELQILLRRIGGGHWHFHPHADCCQPVIFIISVPRAGLVPGPGPSGNGVWGVARRVREGRRAVGMRGDNTGRAAPRDRGPGRPGERGARKLDRDGFRECWRPAHPCIAGAAGPLGNGSSSAIHSRRSPAIRDPPGCPIRGTSVQPASARASWVWSRPCWLVF